MKYSEHELLNSMICLFAKGNIEYKCFIDRVGKRQGISKVKINVKSRSVL